MHFWGLKLPPNLIFLPNHPPHLLLFCRIFTYDSEYGQQWSSDQWCNKASKIFVRRIIFVFIFSSFSDAQLIWSTHTEICFFWQKFDYFGCSGANFSTYSANFFSQILIIMEIRLKFWSTGHLAHYNMSKLIPHYSNRQKIVFWLW